MNTFEAILSEIREQIREVLDVKTISTRVLDSFSWEQILGFFEADPNATLKPPICFLVHNISESGSNFNELMSGNVTTLNVGIYLVVGTENQTSFKLNSSYTVPSSVISSSTQNLPVTNWSFEVGEIFDTPTDQYEVVEINSGANTVTFDKNLPVGTTRLYLNDLTSVIYRKLLSLSKVLKSSDLSSAKCLGMNDNVLITTSGQLGLNADFAGTRTHIWSGLLEIKFTLVEND